MRLRLWMGADCVGSTRTPVARRSSRPNAVARRPRKTVSGNPLRYVAAGMKRSAGDGVDRTFSTAFPPNRLRNTNRARLPHRTTFPAAVRREHVATSTRSSRLPCAPPLCALPRSPRGGCVHVAATEATLNASRGKPSLAANHCLRRAVSLTETTTTRTAAG